MIPEVIMTSIWDEVSFLSSGVRMIQFLTVFRADECVFCAVEYEEGSGQ